MNNVIRIFTVILILGVMVMASVTQAQKKTPLLERTISISLDNVDVHEALKRIGEAGSFTFSYKSSLLDKNERVSYRFVNRSVREVLDEIFKGAISYKERGRYIILVKAPKRASTESSTVSGYVIDEATGRRLQNVSVYDPVSLSSTVTDSYGYFKIDIKNPTGDEIKLAVKKREYTDTLLVVPKGSRRLLNVAIRFDALKKDRLETLADSVGRKLKRFWLETKFATEQAINMENISDSMHRKFQFGFVPFVGTNGKLSGNVINEHSLNVIGGYSLGNDKLEFAGGFNSTRGNVRGVQVAGWFNAGRGTLNGWQLAGLANINGDSANGIQVAGFANLHAGYSSKLKLAGTANVALASTDATQLAGGANFVLGEVRRPQLAGMFNFSTKDTGPAQIAGLFNFTAGSMSGVQLSGVLNVAGRAVEGAQLSGLINIAPKAMRGVQIGVINVSKEMTGVQFGVFNFSKQIKGVPIGLLSFIGKGYHKLEISADEIFYTNISFRSGVRQFYNILTVGASPETFKNDETLWTFGYGVGTAPKLTKWLYLNIDVTTSQVVLGKIEEINLLNKLYGGLDFQLAKNFSITAGVTLNGHVTREGFDNYPELFADYKPSIIRERSFSDDYNLKMWWGGKVGIRFF